MKTPRMPLFMFALAILALILVSIAHSEVNSRHTPGFPEILPENLEELLEYLSRVFGTENVEMARLTELLSSGNVEYIANLLKDEYPRTLIGIALDAYKRGELTEEDLYEYLRALQSWYEQSAGGDADVTEDFLLALRALSALAEKAGYNDFSSRTNELIYDVLRSLLEAEQLSSSDQLIHPLLGLPEPGTLEPPELSLPSSFEVSKIQMPGFSISPPSGWLPAFTPPGFPSISAPAIRVNWELLGWIAIPLLTLFLAFATVKWGSRVTKVFSKATYTVKPLLGVARQKPVEDRLPRSIALYWLAVEYVSKEYGIQRQPGTTHREFLERARHLLESRHTGLLTQLTHIYELVRYGGVHDFSYDDQAERAYRELVREA